MPRRAKEKPEDKAAGIEEDLRRLNADERQRQ